MGGNSFRGGRGCDGPGGADGKRGRTLVFRLGRRGHTSAKPALPLCGSSQQRCGRGHSLLNWRQSEEGPMKALDDVVDTYCTAWNTTDVGDRGRLLRVAWTADCRSSNPLEIGSASGGESGC